MSSKRIFSLRLAWVVAFVYTAKVGNQIEAAAVLECDQSTVSRYLKDLQIWLDRKLFDSFSPVELSQDGKDFMPIAVEVLTLLIGSIKVDKSTLIKAISENKGSVVRRGPVWDRIPELKK